MNFKKFFWGIDVEERTDWQLSDITGLFPYGVRTTPSKECAMSAEDLD